MKFSASGGASLVPVLQKSIVYKHLDLQTIKKIAQKTVLRNVGKGTVIFREQEICSHFHLVVNGLVKVYVTSTNGTRMTYLMAQAGEPLNLIAPFDDTPRQTAAQAMKDTVIAEMSRQDLLSLAAVSPVLVKNIVTILGRAIDSANSRIIDMMEKKVDERLFRALYSLYQKFGSPLNFTSMELANLVGTTTESVLRAMGRLKKQGIVTSSRGRVDVIDPKALERYGIESLWI